MTKPCHETVNRKNLLATLAATELCAHLFVLIDFKSLLFLRAAYPDSRRQFLLGQISVRTGFSGSKIYK